MEVVLTSHLMQEAIAYSYLRKLYVRKLFDVEYKNSLLELIVPTIYHRTALTNKVFL